MYTTSLEPQNNMNQITRPTLALAAFVLLFVMVAGDVFAQANDTPQSRLQPLGAASRVDRYRAPATVRQTVMFQTNGLSAPPAQSSAATAPPVGYPSPPPIAQSPSFGTSLPPSTPPLRPTQVQSGIGLPSPSSAPSGISTVPRSPQLTTAPIASTLDYQPIPQPQLSNTFATVGNCSCVTPASGYTAASVGCGSPTATYAAPAYAPTTGYVPPPTEIASPYTVPGQYSAISRSNGPLPPLFTLGQQYNPVQVGQGIIGQPVAYVPGQSIRNFIRYFFP